MDDGHFNESTTQQQVAIDFSQVQAKFKSSQWKFGDFPSFNQTRERVFSKCEKLMYNSSITNRKHNYFLFILGLITL